MSLFERINNKIKNDLIIEMNNTGSDDPWDDKDTKTNTKKDTKTNTETGKKKKLNSTKKIKVSKDVEGLGNRQGRLDATNPKEGGYSRVDDVDAPKPKKVKFGEAPGAGPVKVTKIKVDTKAKDYTDKINKQNKNRSFFDVTKHKKAREKLIQGRKAYIDPKTNKASKEGIKRYITKARNMASGSNVNNKANQKAAEIIAKSSGKEYADKINQKYGGKLGRKRPSNAKSLEQIQRDINARNPVKPGITGKPIPLKKTSKPSSIGFKNFPGSNVSDKEIQTAIKTGGKKPTANVKKAIKDLDKVVIQPKKGDAQKTARYIRKQIKQNVKKVTTPKVGEVSKAKKILQTYQQQQQQQQPQAGSTTTTRTRTRTNTRTNTGNRTFPDLQKEIEKIKKGLKNPVDQSFGDALKKNQNPSIKKISTPELEKIKPKVTTSKNLGKLAQTKLGSKIPKMQLSKRLMKSKNKYLVGAGLALAGGAYLLGRNRVKKSKEKEKKALIIANQKKKEQPKKLVDVSLFLNRTGTPPKTSKPSYNSVYDKDYIKNLKK